MKIERGRGVGGLGSSKSAPASAASGFTVPVEAEHRVSTASPVSGVTSLDAILALQGNEGPSQRRARQVRRGRDALDALEKLETALVAGRGPASLRGELDSLRAGSEVTGESGLDAVLHEIDIRLAVESAKLERVAQAT
jgi:hypothetical protein